MRHIRLDLLTELRDIPTPDTATMCICIFTCRLHFSMDNIMQNVEAVRVAHHEQLMQQLPTMNFSGCLIELLIELLIDSLLTNGATMSIAFAPAFGPAHAPVPQKCANVTCIVCVLRMSCALDRSVASTSRFLSRSLITTQRSMDGDATGDATSGDATGDATSSDATSSDATSGDATGDATTITGIMTMSVTAPAATGTMAANDAAIPAYHY